MKWSYWGYSELVAVTILPTSLYCTRLQAVVLHIIVDFSCLAHSDSSRLDSQDSPRGCFIRSGTEASKVAWLFLVYPGLHNLRTPDLGGAHDMELQANWQGTRSRACSWIVAWLKSFITSFKVAFWKMKNPGRVGYWGLSEFRVIAFFNWLL